jgi:hypothetical protein
VDETQGSWRYFLYCALVISACHRHVYTRPAYKTNPRYLQHTSFPITPSPLASSSIKPYNPTRFLKYQVSTMKFFTLALAALTSFAAAKDYNTTSSGFRLFLKSDNATLDGSVPLSPSQPILTHPKHRPRRLPPRRRDRRPLHHQRQALLPRHQRPNLLPQRVVHRRRRLDRHGRHPRLHSVRQQFRLVVANDALSQRHLQHRCPDLPPQHQRADVRALRRVRQDVHRAVC